jgi:hypothetical protein
MPFISNNTTLIISPNTNYSYDYTISNVNTVGDKLGYGLQIGTSAQLGVDNTTLKWNAGSINGIGTSGRAGASVDVYDSASMIAYASTGDISLGASLYIGYNTTGAVSLGNFVMASGMDGSLTIRGQNDRIGRVVQVSSGLNNVPSAFTMNAPNVSAGSPAGSLLDEQNADTFYNYGTLIENTQFNTWNLKIGLHVLNEGQGGNPNLASLVDVGGALEIDGKQTVAGHACDLDQTSNADKPLKGTIQLEPNAKLVCPDGIVVSNGLFEGLQNGTQQYYMNAEIDGSLWLNGTSQLVLWGALYYGSLTFATGDLNIGGTAQVQMKVHDNGPGQGTTNDKLYVSTGKVNINQNTGDAATLYLYDTSPTANPPPVNDSFNLIYCYNNTIAGTFASITEQTSFGTAIWQQSNGGTNPNILSVKRTS